MLSLMLSLSLLWTVPDAPSCSLPHIYSNNLPLNHTSERSHHQFTQVMYGTVSALCFGEAKQKHSEEQHKEGGPGNRNHPSTAVEELSAILRGTGHHLH